MKRFHICITSVLLVFVLSLPLTAQNLNVELLGEIYDFWDAVKDIEVSDEFAYCATGETGLRVLDISDVSNPAEIGKLEYAFSVYGINIQDDYVYIACSGGSLRIIDITNPSNPVETGYIEFPGSVIGVDVVENLAYIVGSGDTDFRIIDITDPENPQEVGYCDVSGDHVIVNGNFAYTDGNPGIHAIDISSPSNPFETDYLSDAGYSQGLDVSGDYAFLANYQGLNGYLHVIDITDPNNLELVSTLTLTVPLSDLDVEGNYAYVAAGDLLVVDISDPGNPVLEDEYNGETVYNVYISGEHAFCGAYQLGLDIVNVSETGNMYSEGQYAQDGTIYDVAYADGIAYVAVYNHGFTIVDVSDLENPVEIAWENSAVHAQCVECDGETAFLGEYFSHALRIFDVTDPTNPREVYVMDTGDEVKDMQLEGDYLYVANDFQGMKIIDVSNPEIPVVEGIFDLSACLAVAVEGDYAYLTGQCYYRNNSRIVDISDPPNPVEVAFYHDAALGTLTAEGGFLYVSGGLDVRIFDVTQNTFNEVGGLIVPGIIKSIDSYNGYIFLADGTGGLRVGDVIPPENPLETGYYQSGKYARAVDYSDNIAYVGNNYNLQIFDCSEAVHYIDVSLTPEALPIIIPAGGGDFDFTVEITNNGTAADTMDIWTKVLLPNMTWFGPIIYVEDAVLAPSATISRERTQVVPPNAPAGNYVYKIFIGEYPDVTWTSDEFDFEKLVGE